MKIFNKLFKKSVTSRQAGNDLWEMCLDRTNNDIVQIYEPLRSEIGVNIDEWIACKERTEILIVHLWATSIAIREDRLVNVLRSLCTNYLDSCNNSINRAIDEVYLRSNFYKYDTLFYAKGDETSADRDIMLGATIVANIYFKGELNKEIFQNLSLPIIILSYVQTMELALRYVELFKIRN